MKRLINALFFSINGIKSAFKSEPALRQEVYISIFLIPLAFYLDKGNIQTILMVSSIFLVLICELINSAIEATIDRISKEKHTLSGKAKDIGSAVVLVAILNVIFVWAFILAG